MASTRGPQIEINETLIEELLRTRARLEALRRGIVWIADGGQPLTPDTLRRLLEGDSCAPATPTPTTPPDEGSWATRREAHFSDALTWIEWHVPDGIRLVAEALAETSPAAPSPEATPPVREVLTFGVQGRDTPEVREVIAVAARMLGAEAKDPAPDPRRLPACDVLDRECSVRTYGLCGAAWHHALCAAEAKPPATTPCPLGEDCPDARRYGHVHASPAPADPAPRPCRHCGKDLRRWADRDRDGEWCIQCGGYQNDRHGDPPAAPPADEET